MATGEVWGRLNEWFEISFEKFSKRLRERLPSAFLQFCSFQSGFSSLDAMWMLDGGDLAGGRGKCRDLDCRPFYLLAIGQISLHRPSLELSFVVRANGSGCDSFGHLFLFDRLLPFFFLGVFWTPEDQFPPVFAPS
ncbi:unnamed protein product [Microthlaspi erraticum]|uniref:Uncharacterized protein n=1 Tax=Microthlaspi erraticum TaxID=1685480 RepID=A0A6D2I333_9BRAS|nr:unnamed protein product [Microthlaspi erraticum]